MSKPSNLEILEQKIGLAVEKITTIGAENRVLKEHKSTLESRIEDLEHQNKKLANDGKASQRMLSSSKSSDKELAEIKQRVDSILVNFERLDL